jgi:dihydroorotate dehydrogenase
VIAQFRRAVPADLTLVGVGGIGSGADALAMLNAGAQALQIYTSFIYQGTNLVRNLVIATNK